MGQHLQIILLVSLLFSSCIIVKKFPKNKPFVTSNTIEVKGGKFTTNEKAAIKTRLNAQLADSSRIKEVDKYFIRRVFTKPPAYDSAASAQSARNMQMSMLHIGYYHSTATYSADTTRTNDKIMVHVHYVVDVGPPTLIDTVRYIMRKPDLQSLATKNVGNSLLKVETPVTKASVIGEMGRMVDLYRNNGYYKLSTEEIKVRGDTSTAALTTISDDIFEQLRLLAEAQKAKDSPRIKLAVVLNQPSDSSKIRKYYIGNIYILPDYLPGDDLNDPSLITVVAKGKGKQNCDTCSANFTLKYHKKLFRTGFVVRNMYMRKGDLYNQDNYFQTLNSFTKAGLWQSVNIRFVERKDSSDKLDLVVELIPGKKYGFEAALEASYSATSNSNNATAASAGNLLGISGNVSILNRNVHKEGIRMTNAVRAGVELNVRNDSNNRKNIINSNELTYSNSIIIPRLIYPYSTLLRSKRNITSETFFNTNLSYIKRFSLFDLQSVSLSNGVDWTMKAKKPNRSNKHLLWKPINFEFSRLYNKTATFDSTLAANPFLRYSFNTALVAGFGIGSLRYSFIHINPKFTNRQFSFTANFEESGLILGATPLLKKYLRNYVKGDVEYVFSTTHKKSEIVTRVFAGVGVPIRKDTTLPFFRQYFGGGSNSMRAWPVRGIGRGSQPLAPFGNNSSFNDRTGDIQLEANIEYRYNIAQLVPNSLSLKGAMFMDVGNIWNFKNANPSGGPDSAQFKFKNLYKELGVALGTGFRLDFNYFVLRFDVGFRVKRPDISSNDGWQIPNVTFNNLFKRGVQIPDPANPGQTKSDDRYRKWRYENFNFTIGISYPF